VPEALLRPMMEDQEGTNLVDDDVCPPEEMEREPESLTSEPGMKPQDDEMVEPE
jgi:hypothetical protein